MHQDQTFTSKNILYFILEIGAGEGGGGRGGGGEVRTFHLTYLEFVAPPFFLRILPLVLFNFKKHCWVISSSFSRFTHC